MSRPGKLCHDGNEIGSLHLSSSDTLTVAVSGIAAGRSRS
jgi:hypothetical protein